MKSLPQHGLELVKAGCITSVAEGCCDLNNNNYYYYNYYYYYYHTTTAAAAATTATATATLLLLLLLVLVQCVGKNEARYSTKIVQKSC